MNTDSRVSGSGGSRRRLRALAAGFLIAILCMAASAQDRIIFVNGQLLDEDGIRLVDELNCGQPVPNGNYWLDLENRVWGYVGVAGQEPLPDCSADSAEAPAEEEGDCERKYRIHEDRMCYCYHVC